MLGRILDEKMILQKATDLSHSILKQETTSVCSMEREIRRCRKKINLQALGEQPGDC